MTSLAVVGDLEVASAAQTSKSISHTDLSWLSCLAHRGMLLKRKAAGSSGEWYFSLGRIGGVSGSGGAVLGWPAAKTKIGESQKF
eukprot:4822521-Amphidinium_carterae.1